jgi:hypothetical protein
MEIRKYHDIIGVVTTEDIIEGRMVLMTAHSVSYDFGSKEDLPGVKYPTSAAEAKEAKFIVAFAVDNSSTPIYNPYPSFSFALREGWDQAANVPFNAQVFLTHPGNMRGQTIPSGSLALAFAGGVFTVYSGNYTPSSSLVPGAYVEALNSGDDSTSKGMLQHTSTVADAIGRVVQYDATAQELTFRLDY